MEHSSSLLYRAVIIPLALIMICGLGAWIFLPKNRTLDITDLRKSELHELASEQAETDGDYYTLKAADYYVIGKFYQDTVKMPAARHYVDISYVYYSVQFLDRYGEPVVLALKVRADDHDLEHSASDITGKMVILKEERVNQQKQISSGDPEPEGIMLYETEDISGKFRNIGGRAALLSFTILAVIFVIRQYNKGQEDDPFGV